MIKSHTSWLHDVTLNFLDFPPVKIMAQDSSRSSSFWIWTLLAALCLLGLLIPFVMFVDPAPPQTIVIATGRKDGAYFRFAQQYADLLSKDGITVEVRATAGSVENLKLLSDESSPVTVALVQSGIADPAKSDSLQSLCSLYREPLWIFYRGEETVERLTQLSGKRLAVGPEGSGTRGIALQLLKANGVDETRAELIPSTGIDAAQALSKNEVDAGFFVAGVDATYIQQLLRNPELRLAQLSQTSAYTRRFRFLSSLTIPAGCLLELNDDVPSKDTVLIAPMATLMAKKSLHPALITLLLNAATKVHGGGNLLAEPGEFPSSKNTDLPLSDDAANYFRYGPPMLQRLLPFWLASMVDRLKIMIIPLIMLLMPLIRAAPPLVRWRTRRKIYLWYAQLRQIDRKAIQGMSKEEAESSLAGLNNLEQQLARVGIPLSYMEEYYNLRLHLNLVQSRVATILNGKRSA